MKLARHAPSRRDQVPIYAVRSAAQGRPEINSSLEEKLPACEDWVHLQDTTPGSVTDGIGTGKWPRWWYSFGNGRDPGEECALEPLVHSALGVTQPTFKVAQCLLGATLCYHDSLQSSQISRA